MRGFAADPGNEVKIIEPHDCWAVWGGSETKCGKGSHRGPPGAIPGPRLEPEPIDEIGATTQTL